jgi:hypothetical protein
MPKCEFINFLDSWQGAVITDMCDSREGGTLTGYVGGGGGTGDSTSGFAALSLSDSRELATVRFAQVLILVSLIFLSRNPQIS